VVSFVGENAWTVLRTRGRRLDAAALEALSPILILSPHQDDETLGCGGLIATTCALGLAPRVAYLTDGSASHLGSPTWPAQRIASVRRAEARRALGVLGVPPRDIRFLGWPDSVPARPGTATHDAAAAALARWVRPRPPRSIWSSWRREPHCDHEAAADLADTVAARTPGSVRRLDFLVWGWTRPDLAAETKTVWALDCPGTIARRRRALACHRTQTTALIGDADEAFRIPPEIAALVSRPAEIYLEDR
jgi:LmbE family N-acetylglucosaminyl deacetylase